MGDPLERMTPAELIGLVRTLIGEVTRFQAEYEKVSGALAKLRVEHQAVKAGTILLNGVFQPGKASVTARPDPAKPSRSASLEWG